MKKSARFYAFLLLLPAFLVAASSCTQSNVPDNQVIKNAGDSLKNLRATTTAGQTSSTTTTTTTAGVPDPMIEKIKSDSIKIAGLANEISALKAEIKAIQAKIDGMSRLRR